MKVFRILLILMLGLSGCAPVLSQSLIDSSEPRVLFHEIKKSPDRHVGRTVILGGTVIKVTRENDHHIVEILQRPLGSRLQPLDTDKTGGRFLARFDNLDEDTVLQADRPITLGGKVMGQERRPLDRTEYAYPVIQVDEYHLWRGWDADPGASPRFFWSFGLSGNL